MADGFIVRKGGVVSGTLAPSLTLVSKTDTEIVFTITNNDPLTADIFWEVGDTTPDANTLSLATATTSSNQTISGLTQNTEYIIYAFANAADKAGSPTVTLTVTTDAVVYTAATGGTTEEYDSDGKRYKSHTFTSDDDFVVTTVGDVAGDRNKVDYLIIAGGGGGGTNGGNGTGAGAGGAGGYRTTLGTSGGDTAARTKVTVTATTFGIVIGAGGTGATDRTAHGANGTASTALSVSTVGGGGGASDGGGSSLADTPSGGSGGGGTGAASAGVTAGMVNGGAGTTDEGFAGGSGKNTSPNGFSGGGGGGAGSIGTTATSSSGGTGGLGLGNILRTGSSETRGVGGTGGHSDSIGISNGADGTANTGNGGGGSNANANGGNGGSGIVVIRYEIAPSV